MTLLILFSSLGTIPVGSISFDDNGWLHVAGDAGPLFTAAEGWPANVQVDDTPLLSEMEEVDGGPMDGERGVLAWRYSTRRGTLTVRLAPFQQMGAQAWLRSLIYKNTSDTVQDLTHAVMRLAPVVDDAVPMWEPRNFYLAKGRENACIGIAYRGTTDFYRLSVQDNVVQHDVEACWRLQPGQGAVIEAQGLWVSFLPDAGEQPAPWWAERFRIEGQRWFDALGIKPPEGMPDWVRGMILYEYNAGGHIDSRFSDVGGFVPLGKQSAGLAEMGVTAVWLQGIHGHKTPPNPMEGGWNLYDPRDVLSVDTIMGGEGGLRQLLGALESAGLRVLGEIVPHGGHSVQAEALPEWWSYERDGAARRNWGGCGMDHASPPWQEIMAGAMAWQTRDFGIVGCRIDVADGNGPNWKSPLTNHASFSTLGGAVQLLTRVREAMSEHTPYPVLIPEAFDQVEYFPVAPIGYGHDFWMFIVNQIDPIITEPAEMAKQFQEHLERERGALPRGALTLRTLNNHDTVCEAGRVHHRFGFGLSRALHALCLMVPGVPMLYQEQEIGSWFALRDLHRARQRIPAFVSDEADYFAVEFAPEVFACLRGNPETGVAIGLANLSGNEIAGEVRILLNSPLMGNISLSEDTPIYDALSGLQAVIRNGVFPWRMAPYGAAFIQIGEGTEPTPTSVVSSKPAVEQGPPTLVLEEGRLYSSGNDLEVSFMAGGDGWMLGADDGEGRTYMNGMVELQTTQTDTGLDCLLTFVEQEDTPWPVLEVRQADTWFVSGRTALLHDKAIRRHYPWPEESGYGWDASMCWGPKPAWEFYTHKSPTGRLWESVFEPLHPDAPAVGFFDGTGGGVLVRDIVTNCANLVLYEAATNDLPVLHLSFRGYDRDLAASLNSGGPGVPYTRLAPEPDPRRRYTAAFRLMLIEGNSDPNAFSDIAVSRLPVNRKPYAVHLEGDGAQVNGHIGAILPHPGAVVWENLTLPNGHEAIQFTLRHSETGPEGTDLDDAYRININGQEVPFTWSARNVSRHDNAYFGHAVVRLPAPSEEIRTIRIESLKHWCIVKERFHLI